MFRGFRLVLGAALVLALPGAPAWAQYFGGYGGYWGWGGWGATPQGDIARGMGAYAQGVGVYNLATAQAASINTDTMMRWNSYLWSSQNSLNREHYARMLADRERNKRLTDQIATRIRETPNEGDVERGDALNAVLEQLSDPRIHPSALRLAKVPLKSSWIQEIPFHYASEAVALSLHRFSSREGWPAVLLTDKYRQEREDYLKTIDAALEEDKERDLRADTIQAVENAAEKLRQKVDDTIPKTSPDYIPAQNFLKSVYGMVNMLRRPQIDQVLAALQNYPGTTVADLLAFMQMFNLRFAPATTPRERGLYLSLYPLLDEQRDKILQQSAARAEGAPAPPGGAAAGIFHEMPWENLLGRSGSTNEKKTPRPQ